MALMALSRGDDVTGMEVLNNYGAKPNDELLLGYGFVQADNPEDQISVKLGSTGGSDASKILAAFGLPLSKIHYIRRNATELPKELLAQLRVLTAEEEELQGLKDALKEKEIDIEQPPAVDTASDSERWKGHLGRLTWPNEYNMVYQLDGMFNMKLEGLKAAVERAKDAAHGRQPKRRKTAGDPLSLEPSTNGVASAKDDDGSIREENRANIEEYLRGAARRDALQRLVCQTHKLPLT